MCSCNLSTGFDVACADGRALCCAIPALMRLHEGQSGRTPADDAIATYRRHCYTSNPVLGAEQLKEEQRKQGTT